MAKQFTRIPSFPNSILRPDSGHVTSRALNVIKHRRTNNDFSGSSVHFACGLDASYFSIDLCFIDIDAIDLINGIKGSEPSKITCQACKVAMDEALENPIEPKDDEHSQKASE